MENVITKNKWLAGTGSLIACGLAVALMRNAPSGSGTAMTLSARAQAELASSVSAANQAAAAAHSQEVAVWRQYLQSARSPQKLKAFVSALRSFEQKLKSGAALFRVGESDEQRVMSLFRNHILDERKLASEMQATVDAYERRLFEQDRPLIEAAGISREAWSRMVNIVKPHPTVWRAKVRPVITRAACEVRQDVARFGATWLAGDKAGDGIKKVARATGLDKSEKGSWGDLISGVVIDAAVSAAIDAATDPTEGIVSRLGSEMAGAERELLEGDQGLFTVMRRLKSAHESARNSLLTTAEGR